MPFVAPDVLRCSLWPQTWMLCSSLWSNFSSLSSSNQSNQHPIFLPVFLTKVSEVFHPLQTISTLKQFQPYRLVFLLLSLLSLGGFSSIKSPVFLPHFLIKFKRVFDQLNIHGFLFSLPLGLGGFFSLSNKAMTSNAYTLVGAYVQEEMQL